MSNVEYLGTGPKDPLWITSLNHHVSGTLPEDPHPDAPTDPKLVNQGVKIGENQQGHTGKMDSLGGAPSNPNKRFLRTTEGDFEWYPLRGHLDGKHFPTYSTTLEASAEGKNNYRNDSVHLQVGNNKSLVITALLGRTASELSNSNEPDYSRNHTIVGLEGMPNKAVSLSDTGHQLIGGDWGKVDVGTRSFYGGARGKIPTSDIEIRDLTVRRELRVGNNVTDLRVSDVIFAGEQFNIATIGKGSTLTLTNPQFPDCAKIDGDGVLILDGVEKKLPYMIDPGSELIEIDGEFNDDENWRLRGVCEVEKGQLSKGPGPWSIAEFDSKKFEPNTESEVTFNVRSLGGIEVPLLNIGAPRGKPIERKGLNKIVVKSGIDSRIGLRFSASSRAEFVIDDVNVQRFRRDYNFVKNGEFIDNEGWRLAGDCKISEGVLEKKGDRLGLANYQTREFEPEQTYMVEFDVLQFQGPAIPTVHIMNTNNTGGGEPINGVGHYSIPVQSGKVAHSGLWFTFHGRSKIKIDNVKVRHPMEPLQ